jgi:hypothetical protein
LEPIAYTLKLVRVHAEMAIPHHNAQEFNVALFEVAFGGFEEEVILPKEIEDAMDIGAVAGEVLFLAFAR